MSYKVAKVGDSYQLLLTLYRDTTRKYLKIRGRLEKNVKNGRFKSLSSKKRAQIISTVNRLKAKLQRLSLQLKLGIAGGSLALLLSSNDTLAQTIGPFNQTPRSENPVKGPLLGFGFVPTAIDLDKDGKVDIVAGDSSGELHYYHNDGTIENGKLVPKFNELTGTSSPFNGISVVNDASPAFADFTGDNEPDLVVAQGNGVIRFFRNNGSGTAFTEQTGPWNSGSKDGNPFDGFPNSPNPRIKLVDFDGDGDIDLLLGASYDNGGGGEYIVLHESDGQGNFIRNSTISFPGSSVHRLPEVVDIDADGDFDLFVGVDDYYSTTIDFYRRNSATTFGSESGPWDGAVGNPLESFNFDDYGAPLLVDLDNDGDLDAVVGRNLKYGASTYENSLAYLENTGNFNFEEKIGFENPFDGVLGGEIRRPAQGATPTFIDIDNDSDLDLVLGEKYTGILSYYQYDNAAGTFNKKTGAENPFDGASLSNASTAEPYDFDGDGKIDLMVGEGFASFFFKNNGDGSFTKETADLNTVIGFLQQQDLVFIDVDGDLDDDVFVGYYGGSSLRFYRNNDGTYVDETGTAPTPFDDAGTLFSNLQTRPTVADIDGDGINDLIFGVGNGNSSSVGTIRVFVNNANNSFTELSGAQNPLGGVPQVVRPSPYAIDFDQDGDIDFFIGQRNGISNYIRNENPPPVTTVSSSTLVYIFGSGPVVLDATITISDSDSDEISKAVLVLQGYQTGDVLGFTPQGNVTGSFDSGVGILTLTGLAPASTYQDILRSVTYDFTGAQPSSAGKSSPSGRTVVVNKSIDLSVFDSDGTTPAIQSLAVALTVPNVIPVMTTSAGSSVFTGSPIVVDAALTVVDADDPDIVSATIQISAATFISGEDDLLFIDQNGITGSYNGGTGILSLSGTATVANYQAALQSIQYRNVSGTPTGVSRTIEFTVNDGEVSSALVSKSVTISIAVNQPPVLSSSPQTVAFKGTLTLDLATIASDPDGNLDTGSFGIVQQPLSGILASLTGTILTIDYSASNFAGADNVIIEVYDLGGERAEATIPITVTNQAPVITPTPANVTFNGVFSLNLSTITTDSDGNVDPTTFAIVQQPTSGIAATVSGTTLTINYAGSNFVGSDNVIVEVYDLAGARAEATLSINVTNQAPVIAPAPISIGFNGSVNLDLATITTDLDGNVDPTTYGIFQQPASGVAAVISGTILSINYSGSNFAGADNVIVEVFDLAGARAEANISITVINQAPVITPTQVNTVVQGMVSIDLLTIVTDSDNNLDPSTFNVFQQPLSGAPVTIAGTILTVDYSSSTFAGNDNLIVEVFDLAGERAEAIITIDVAGEVVVRNGISPNGDGFNDFFKLDNITALGPQNTVKIFTRWGDKVFEVKDYDNLNRRFEGKSDNGKDLPSGVYFYKVSFDNGKEGLSGYLTLKR